MDKVRLEILGLSSSQTQVGSFALVLGEKGGNRRLPIIIGAFEAQAIALGLENIKPNRPLTHDLILSLSTTFEIELLEVLISDLKEGVFYSKLIMSADGNLREVDARPSDAIALSVRFHAPIYTYPFILEEAGIVIKDLEPTHTEGTEREKIKPKPAQPKDTSASLNKNQLLKTLNDKMNDAINREDYEEAARLRDEINKLEQS